jgi:hypothetical protein
MVSEDDDENRNKAEYFTSLQTKIELTSDINESR